MVFLQVPAGGTGFNGNPCFLAQFHVVPVFPANLTHPEGI